MGYSRSHEMAEVVGLEVETVGKSSLLVLVSYLCAYHGLFLVGGMGVYSTVAFVNYYGSVYISVLALRLDHLVNEFVHESVKFRILVYRIDCGNGFKPFIHVSVMERRPPMLAFLTSGRNLKIAETV